MKQRRFTTAAWMLVPVVLAVPALVAGLSIWYDWGPEWPALALFLAGLVLAFALDARRALRGGLIGLGVGLITCPLLLLFHADWELLAIWSAGTTALAALLAPLQSSSPRRPAGAQYAGHAAQGDADALEPIATQHNPGD